MTKIELLEDMPGTGAVGEVIEVSDSRAERWVRKQMAILPGDPKPAKKKATKKKAE